MKPKKVRARAGLADDGIMSAEIIALAHALSAAGSGRNVCPLPNCPLPQ
jgi:hypothetical protein